MTQDEIMPVEKLYKVIVGILVSCLVLLAFVGHQFWVSSLKPLDPQASDSVTVEIQRGFSRTDISKILEDKGIIKSAFVFNYYARFNNEKIFLQGLYKLSPAMSFDEILEQIQKQ